MNANSNVRAICVDDDPILRSLIGAKIAPLTAEFVEAEDGVIAWDLMRNGNFDIAFIDLLMPNLDGFNLIRCIRANDRTKHTPIVVISSSDDTGSVRTAFEAGASSFQSKPINWIIFEPLVAHLLKLANSARALDEQIESKRQIPHATAPYDEIYRQLIDDLRKIKQIAETAADSDDPMCVMRSLRDISQRSGSLVESVSSYESRKEQVVA